MKPTLTATIALLAVIFSFSAQADTAGDHPGYLHALTDLRGARWNLQHRPGDTRMPTLIDRVACVTPWIYLKKRMATWIGKKTIRKRAALNIARSITSIAQLKRLDAPFKM
jgi:hypothetical protein